MVHLLLLEPDLGCRGDIINSSEPTMKARVPNPQRLVKAYNQSAATLNLLRGFATGAAWPQALLLSDLRSSGLWAPLRS